MSEAKITVRAGEHDRHGCPVTVTIDSFSGLDNGTVTLIDQDGERSTGQYTTSKETADITWIVNNLSAHTQRTYTISSSPSQSSGSGVSFSEQDNAIGVSVDGRHFTTFRYGTDQYRPYFFPVHGPGGRQVTRGETSEESKDHIHHRSLYVAYGEVNHADFWSEGQNAGRIIHKNFTERSEGSVVGRIYTQNSWVDKSGNPLMSDLQNFRIYALPEDRAIIDLDLTLLAEHGDVFFGDTKEGGIITVRVNPQMNASNETGKIENAFGGINENETWGKKAHWCDYSGVVDGTSLGVAVFDHLSNPRYPTYWHVRNYGLMGSNIFGGGTFEGDKSKDGSYTLQSGAQMDFRFRVYIHAGDATQGNVGQRYHDFINPPDVVAS